MKKSLLTEYLKNQRKDYKPTTSYEMSDLTFNNMIYGIASDGSRFDETSPEVIARHEKFPDETMEFSISSAITEYENTLVKPETEEAPESTTTDAPVEPEVKEE